MNKRILSILFLILINFTYVDLHAYAHIFGNDDGIETCDHDDFFRNGESLSLFNLPDTFVKLHQYLILPLVDETIRYQFTADNQLLDVHYTNLPPPDLF